MYHLSVTCLKIMIANRQNKSKNAGTPYIKVCFISTFDVYLKCVALRVTSVKQCVVVCLRVVLMANFR